jgi:hypothetical protein
MEQSKGLRTKCMGLPALVLTRIPLDHTNKVPSGMLAASARKTVLHTSAHWEAYVKVRHTCVVSVEFPSTVESKSRKQSTNQEGTIKNFIQSVSTIRFTISLQSTDGVLLNCQEHGCYTHCLQLMTPSQCCCSNLCWCTGPSLPSIIPFTLQFIALACWAPVTCSCLCRRQGRQRRHCTASTHRCMQQGPCSSSMGQHLL